MLLGATGLLTTIWMVSYHTVLCNFTHKSRLSYNFLFFSSFFLATNMLLQLLALLNYTHLVGLWNCWKHCMYCTPRFLCSYIHVLYTAHCSQALLLQAHIGNLQQCFIAREQSEEYIFYSSDISCENNSFNI